VDPGARSRAADAHRLQPRQSLVRSGRPACLAHRDRPTRHGGPERNSDGLRRGLRDRPSIMGAQAGRRGRPTPGSSESQTRGSCGTPGVDDRPLSIVEDHTQLTLWDEQPAEAADLAVVAAGGGMLAVSGATLRIVRGSLASQTPLKPSAGARPGAVWIPLQANISASAASTSP